MTDKQIADIFTINLVLSALHARNVTPGLSEAAIDTLCVAGLVNFPPTEAGPLNLAARLGQRSLLGMFDECTKMVPFLVDVGGVHNSRAALISTELFPDTGSESSDTEKAGESLVDIFQGHRSDMILLSYKDLRKVGRAYGVQNKELVLCPLLIALFLVTVFLILGAVCGIAF